MMLWLHVAKEFLDTPAPAGITSLRLKETCRREMASRGFPWEAPARS
jgi:hypothetical protein